MENIGAKGSLLPTVCMTLGPLSLKFQNYICSAQPNDVQAPTLATLGSPWDSDRNAYMQGHPSQPQILGVDTALNIGRPLTPRAYWFENAGL